MDNLTMEEVLAEYRLSLIQIHTLDFLLLSGLYLLVFLVGLAGNLVIIYLVSKLSAQAQHNTSRDRVLVNLCVADLLVILVCCPAAVASSGTKLWLLGAPCCKLLFFLQGSTLCTVQQDCVHRVTVLYK
ncbi:hypothetical protein LAZ67_8003966 [Cordylochernes scorpioides]|uniref:G-protein coupled receptors family 1 profile domain-containing protein n=1 Tax=Cordylochernes scorpioides TaxID=51811 RepID=A0ABY6KRZ7_9ARAC|nr:hypothetical protein LAZ67_8003966 [Cordylochernes scorpioides]